MGIKPKFVWLALPLVLFVLVVGVKWRGEHPTPTGEELQVRALLANSSTVTIRYREIIGSGPQEVSIFLSKAEFIPFVEALYIRPDSREFRSQIANGHVNIEYLFPLRGKQNYSPVDFSFDLHEQREKVDDILRITPKIQTLHPVTMKRWRELLLAHPSIGPALREQMKF